MLWQILLQFILRLTFGVALAMTITPSRLVTSGFYRVHLWVLMGVNVFGSLILFSGDSTSSDPWVLSLLVPGLALLSYLGSVIWLYEAPRAGWAFLFMITIAGLCATVCQQPWEAGPWNGHTLLTAANLATSGLLLGSVLTAMLLGHWYLNTPTMQLAPLKRLLLLLFAALVLRMLTCGAGLVLEWSQSPAWGVRSWLMIGFRWLAGLAGTLGFSLMAWQTLKIPNTQSATGILYAAVILTFLGELVALLLGVDMRYPL
ncbi:MAG: hypothetical protein GY888_12585 [Planctomycetaceae bacterium]|nr:hypothetical protein [Planctomycetaceae bacterium]